MTAPKRPAALDDLLGFVEANLAPTEAPTPKPSLDCPGCGSEVFIRDTAAWYTDDEELCAGCGSRVMVALDEDDADPDLLTARVYIYEHGGEVVARLTEERDAIWAERVEEGKVAARAGREAARLADMLAVSDARLTECQGLLASERESSASIAAGFEQLAAKLDAHEALAEVQIARLTEERDEARLSNARRAFELGGKLRNGRVSVTVVSEGKVSQAYSTAEVARAWGWGYLYPEDSTTAEPGNAEYIAWSDGGMVGPAPGHGEPEQ